MLMESRLADTLVVHLGCRVVQYLEPNLNRKRFLLNSFRQRALDCELCPQQHTTHPHD